MEKSPDLSAKLLKYRHTSTQGTTIRMHRALRSLSFTRGRLLTMLLLPLFFDLVLYFNIDSILHFWSESFTFLIDRLRPEGHLATLTVAFPTGSLDIPFPDLPTFAPSSFAIWMNIAVSIMLFVLSGLIPKNLMPLIYLLRAALLIQISASVYFLVSPGGGLYSMGSYITCMLGVGIYLIFLVSPLLAVIYYIFDFPFWRKFVVTTLVISYFIFVLPLQYMLHAIVINSWGLLFMPLLYLMFALLLDTLMFVCWYSWAMTWRPRNLN
jgi:hypothetical protein